MRLMIICLLLLMPISAGAQSLTLRQALVSGLEKNPGYLSRVAQSEAVEAAARVAGSQHWPKLSLQENLVRSNEPGNSLFIALNQEQLELSNSADAYNYPPTRSDFETRLQLAVPLYNPDIKYSVRQARSQVRSVQAGLEAAREALAMQIFSAYLDIQRSQAEQQRVTQLLEETSEILRLARERENSGTGLRADTLSAEVQQADSQRQLVSARNQVLLAQHRLGFLIGSEDPVVAIAEPLSVDFITPLEVGKVSDRADLEALKWQIQSAEEVQLQARAAWLPRLQAGASWSHHDEDYPFSDDADSWTVQAGLSWQLFDGMARSHQSAQALALKKSAEESYRQQLRQAQLEQVEAALDAETAERQLVTGRLALEAASEGYQLMLSRYRNGLATMAELLSVQAQLAKIRAGLTAAQIHLIGTRAKQHFVAGRLLESLMDEKGSLK